MTAPQRHQRQRTAGWRAPIDAVYVGRPTPWGNPFRVPIPPDVAVDLYRDLVTTGRAVHDGHVFERAARGPLNVPTPEIIRDRLAGKDLVCWCPPEGPCHADVLLELANPQQESS